MSWGAGPHFLVPLLLNDWSPDGWNTASTRCWVYLKAHQSPDCWVSQTWSVSRFLPGKQKPDHKVIGFEVLSFQLLSQPSLFLGCEQEADAALSADELFVWLSMGGSSWASWDEDELLPTAQKKPGSVKTLREKHDLLNCSFMNISRGVRSGILYSNVHMWN